MEQPMTSTASHAMVDARPNYYLEAAVAASETASEAIAAAADAAQAAAASWLAAHEAWECVRKSRSRRDLELPPHTPTGDLGGAIHELAQSIRLPFPGGSRDAWERFCEHANIQVAKPLGKDGPS